MYSEILHRVLDAALAKAGRFGLTIRWSSSRLAVSVPDTNALRSLFYLSQVRATAGLMDAIARRDECVHFLCAPGISTAPLLDPAESELSNHRLRCVRVYGPASGGLALRELIAQIVGRADPDALTDHDLKTGFVTLTETGEDHDRVVLLVTEAHNLQSSAMHYIQFACRSSPRLRVALAGQPSLAATLATDDFAYLRQRLTLTLELPGPLLDELPDLLPEASLPSSMPIGINRDKSRLLIRLGVVATLVLLIGMIGWRHMPAPLLAGLRVDGPAADNQAVQVHATPTMPIAAAPFHQPETAAANQQRAETVEQQTDEVFPPDVEPDAAAIPLLGEGPPLEQAPVPSEAALTIPPLEPPVPIVSTRAVEALQKAEPAAPDAAPAPPAPAFAVTPRVPPQSRSRASAVAVLPEMPRARGDRGATERIAAAAGALPIHPAGERQCRDIVLHAQLGKDLSDVDKQFLRDDCRAK